MFCIQYDATGFITGTVQGDTAPINLPAGISQLTFDTWQDTTNKQVDLATLQLVDAPPIVG